jgi:dephospho-CoA kinase
MKSKKMLTKIIVAIVGMPGSGKTEVTKFFIKKGFDRVYFGDITFEEMKRRNLKINEANERKIREEIRKRHGMAAYAILSLSKIRKFYKEGNVVIESLYSWDEYKVVKDEFGSNFKVVAVYAPPQMRYARLKNRPARPCTKEEAQSRDYAQIENLAIAGPIAMADYTILNIGTLEDLFKKTEETLASLIK